MAKRWVGGTPALRVVTGDGVAHTVHPYDHDPRATGWGHEAAKALGVEPARVFKTLVADVDGALVVAVVPVAGQLDLRALAAARGGRRAAMAAPATAERATGHVVGGISPLGHRTRLPVVLDASALDHPTVLVSAGRRGLQVELDPRDLARLADAQVAAVARL